MTFEWWLRRGTLLYLGVLALMSVVSVTLVNVWWDIVIGPIVADAYGVPVGEITEGYTLWSSLFYSATLCVVGGWVLMLLKRLDCKVDWKFILALFPYIILGSVLRVMEDAGTISAPWSVLVISPIIYFVLTALIILVIYVVYRLKFSRNNQLYTIGVFGTVVLLVSLALLFHGRDVVQKDSGLLFGALLIVCSLSVLVLLKSKTFHQGEHLLTAVSHMIDGTATFIGVAYLGYYEKHPLPSMLISRFGAWVMFPLKIGMLAFVFFAMKSMKKETDNDVYHIVWLAVMVLGLAPGVRDVLRMVLGV